MTPREWSIDGVEVRVYDELDSTMDEARRLGRDGWRGIVAARTQHAGRGTGGRRWASPQGGVYLSWLRPYDPDQERYVHVLDGCALAVVAAFERFAFHQCRIRAPNDVMVGGRKIAGILKEVWPEGLILGVGVNVDSAGAQIGDFAVSYRDVTGQTLEPEAFLAAFVRAFNALHDDYPASLREGSRRKRELLLP